VKKAFPTLDVMGVYTGFVLNPKGFAGTHEVMDHFYPGIMTIGTAAMAPNASKEIARQIPEVATVSGDPAKWEEYGHDAVRLLGPTLELDGPLNPSTAEVSGAFESFMEKGPTP
jgi:hypothetical protein